MSKLYGMITGTNQEQSLSPYRIALLQHMSKHPWNLLTARDEDGTPIIITKDESDDKHPYKGWPAEKLYLKAVVEALFDKWKVVLINKSRQMMLSTLCCIGGLYWYSQFRQGRKCLLSKQTEDEALEMVQEKIVNVHLRTPEWFQRAKPIAIGRRRDNLTGSPKRIICVSTDSVIQAVKQNAAVRALRGGTASVVDIDEAAFQEEFGAMIQAAGPMASRLWAITTANSDNPGALEFQRLMEEGRGEIEGELEEGDDENGDSDDGGEG